VSGLEASVERIAAEMRFSGVGLDPSAPLEELVAAALARFRV
jgi:hypothetical protein